MDDKIHKFEKAGLGKAPFRVIGHDVRVGPIKLASKDGIELTVGAPGQPMGTCDYCSQGIALCFTIESADGKRFIVGSDCVLKTGDAGLKTVVDKVRLGRDRAKRAAKASANQNALEELLASEAVRTHLSALPHSRGFTDRQTGAPLTALDEVEWLARFSGASGRARLLKNLRSNLPAELLSA